MTVQRGLQVKRDAVFPNGAFADGEVAAVDDFDTGQPAPAAGKKADWRTVGEAALAAESAALAREYADRKWLSTGTGAMSDRARTIP